MLTNHFRERAVLGFVGVQRLEVLLDFCFEALGLVLSNFASKRLFGHLRGVDPEAFGLCVQIRIDRDADGLLGGLEVVSARAHEVDLALDPCTMPVLMTLVNVA